MNRTATRERVAPSELKETTQTTPGAVAHVQPAINPQPPTARKRRQITPEQRRRLMHQRQIAQVQHRVQQKQAASERFEHELKEMRQTHDLADVDDDVEDYATLYEWRAQEYEHQDKSPAWYATYAATFAIICAGFLIFGNIMAALTIGAIAAFVYYIIQHEPSVMRYRIMTEGVAFNDTLYHFQDLQAFNVVYEPGEVKTVVMRSKRPLAPILHMEIGDADPVMIRDILGEFVVEDQELYEPLVDIWARRLGF